MVICALCMRLLVLQCSVFSVLTCDLAFLFVFCVVRVARMLVLCLVHASLVWGLFVWLSI